MANHPLTHLLRHLRHLAGAGQKTERTDRQLLQCFAAQHDEDAFALLVRRHGAMVFGVCRRLLSNSHDAEDAFQATFVLLAQKANSARWRESVAGWLHEAARRVAHNARRLAARRRDQERQAAALRVEAIPSPETDAFVRLWLDEELRRLPEKHRLPLVLCHLEGHSHEETARLLGWPVGTVKGRIARALEQLRRRLAREGEPCSAGGVALALGEHLPPLTPPETLARTTSNVAVLVARGAPVPESVSALLVGTFAGKAKMALALAMLFGVLVTGAVVAMNRLAPEPSLPGERASAPTPPVDGVASPTDRYGDPLPPGALARFGTVRLRHGDSHWSIAFSPDGKTLASGSGCFDPVIRFWDAGTGKELRRIQVYRGFPIINGGVMAIAFSPDGKILAAGTHGGNWIGFWDTATGRSVQSASGHKGGVTTIAFSPDGKTLASGSYDKTVRLWDTATGDQLLQINGHQGSVYSVRFSPDGVFLATGSEDKTIRLWDAKTGAERRCFKGHEKTITSVAFDSTGKQLASGSSDKTVRLWDVATGREIRQMKGHRNGVSAVLFCRGDKQLVSGSRDRTVRLWDCASGRQLQQFAGDRIDVASVALSPDGRRVAAGSFDNGICVWNIASGKEVLPFDGHKGWILSLFFLPDGKTLASGATDGTVRLSDPQTGKQIQRFGVDGEWIADLAFSPDGRTFASANYENSFALRETAAGAVRRTFVGHTNGVIAVAFSPDGEVIASGSQDKTARLWEAATGKALHVLAGHQDEIRALVFSPDGKSLALAEGMTTPSKISLINVVTGEVFRRIACENHYVRRLAFTPQGDRLISCGEDGTIRIWDTATGKELRHWTTDHRGALHGFSCIALSPDGKFVASAGQDFAVRIWEVATGAEVLCYRGHLGFANSVAFSPDGRSIASGSRDSTVLVWDATGRTSNGKVSKTPLDGNRLETLWSDLAGADAARAYRAIWALAAAPEQSLPLLHRQLFPVPPIDTRRTERLIADLDSDRFAVREKATTELTKLGDGAEAALRKQLQLSPSPEMRRRIEQVVEKVQGSEKLRLERAMVVLEQIGNSEARQFLTSLARGAAEARLTREAKAILERRKRSD